jgi:hypothetical protein
VADTKLAFLGQSSGNLLRTPVAPDQGSDHGPVWRAKAAPPGLEQTPEQRQQMGMSRKIATVGAIAPKFATDRGFVYADCHSDLALTMSCLPQSVNLVSLLTGELLVGSHQGSFDLAIEQAAMLHSSPAKLQSKLHL